MEYEHLEKVKGILGISGNFQDDTLKPLIYEVIEDMVDSGVNRTVAMSEKAIGAVAIGVNDIWNYTAGQVKHSPYFESRCIKLSYVEPEEVNEPEEVTMYKEVIAGLMEELHGRD